MRKATTELIKIVDERATEQNAWYTAREALQRGADITAPCKTGPMINSVIAEEKRLRPIIPWQADNSVRLIQVLEKGASDRLTVQVLAENGSDHNQMCVLVQLRASCHQRATYGPLGLLGSLLKQDQVPIRLEVVQFLIESDPHTKGSLTAVNDQQPNMLVAGKTEYHMSSRCY
jgi:hypothetical protein